MTAGSIIANPPMNRANLGISHFSPQQVSAPKKVRNRNLVHGF